MNKTEFDLKGKKIALSMPINRPIVWQVFMATFKTMDLMRKHGASISLQLTINCNFIHTARNIALDTFLKSDCDLLFFIDEDVAWKPEDFARFVALSSKMDVICAAYRVKDDEPKFWFHEVDLGKGDDFNEFGCLPVGGTGLGFTIINRHVLEDLAGKARRVHAHPHEGKIARVFDLRDIDGDEYSEDILFFDACREAGYTVWLDPSIDLSHVGEKAYSGSVNDIMRSLRVGP